MAETPPPVAAPCDRCGEERELFTRLIGVGDVCAPCFNAVLDETLARFREADGDHDTSHDEEAFE